MTTTRRARPRASLTTHCRRHRQPSPPPPPHSAPLVVVVVVGRAVVAAYYLLLLLLLIAHRRPEVERATVAASASVMVFPVVSRPVSTLENKKLSRALI